VRGTHAWNGSDDALTPSAAVEPVYLLEHGVLIETYIVLAQTSKVRMRAFLSRLAYYYAQNNAWSSVVSICTHGRTFTMTQSLLINRIYGNTPYIR